MEKASQMISVIIPIYNVEKYLPQCLDSICAQTYRELEIILVDDGSADRSGGICDEWARKDPRIRVIHKKNGGVSSARNEGLKAAKGSLIGFVDADDWLEPGMYEKMVRALLAHPDADAVSCGYVDYPYGPDMPVQRGLKPLAPCGAADAVTAMFEWNGYFSSVWNKLFRRELVMQGGNAVFFDTSISFGEDEVWLVSVLRRCGKVVFVPEALYHWRARDGSMTRLTGITKKQLSILKAKKKAFRLLPEGKKLKELAEARIYNDCFFLQLEAYCEGKRSLYRKLQKTLQPCRRAWFRSGAVAKARKAKYMLAYLEMKLRMPAGVVRFTDSINRSTGKVLVADIKRGFPKRNRKG
jgi:glycosyltransferase involved in cell wall biosynthesis